MEAPRRRSTLHELLDIAVGAVDPRELTRAALSDVGPAPATLIGIGKGAAAMCRGAADALGDVVGLCVTNAEDRVPEGVELVVGDHPIPGDRSFEAGRKAVNVAVSTTGPILALVSGGGSALCELPRSGVSPDYIRYVNRTLLDAGASIEETNLVRRHLSAIKNGGLARQAGRPLDTYLISDVCGADPAVVSSGPTIYRTDDPATALGVLEARHVDVPAPVREAIEGGDGQPPPEGLVKVVADGHTAATALARAAESRDIEATVMDGWVEGDVLDALERFFAAAGPGLTIAAGEPEVRVSGKGRGGRCTHAAVLAAQQIAGTDAVFAAFATDGVDGSSASAGAMVDGSTLGNGGETTDALKRSDTATYLQATNDLLPGGPTGTNVSDLWVLWR